MSAMQALHMSQDSTAHPHHGGAAVIGDDYLLAYVQGTLDPAEALLVAVHCTLSCEARRRVRHLADCLAATLEQAPPQAMRCSAQVFFEEKCTDPCDGAADRPPERSCAVPRPLRAFIGEDYGAVLWSRMRGGIGEYRLSLPDSPLQAVLVRLEKGAKAPVHAHTGDDLLLVLCGELDDNGQRYKSGDTCFYPADARLYHHVQAVEECLCLAVLHAPVRFRSLWRKLAAFFQGAGR